MATSAKAFIAGVGSTFVILAIGFAGGLMMAKSALHEPAGYQTRAARSDALAPVRVILPYSAEPAQPPQQASPQPEPIAQPAIPPVLQAQASTEKADPRKAEVEEVQLKRRYAERKVRRQAEARVRQQREQRQPREHQGAPILAFSGESSPGFGGGFFGN